MSIKEFLLIFISFIAATQTLYSQPEQNLILSEIMFRPSSQNGEFIELYNPSGNQPVNLAAVLIKYQTSNADHILPVTGGTILAPAQFAVILEGDYDFENGIYKNLIPSNALVVKLADKAFGSGGMSNSSNRTIALLDTVGDTISVYTYSANNPVGISDEKIIPGKNNSPQNWKNSVVLNGTPGFANSVSPKKIDLALINVSVNPTQLVEGKPFLMLLKIKNLGIQNSGQFTVNGYSDVNLDSIAQANELFFSKTVDSLNSSDSITINVNIDSLQAGVYQFVFKINSGTDEDSSNNKAIIGLTVSGKPYHYNDVVINEIMYKPKTGEPEWIELFNRSGKTINLKNWAIHDKSSSAKISKLEFNLSPNRFVVLSDDSSLVNFYNIPSAILILNLPSLNNGGDQIVIMDSVGTLIDSVEYSSSWGGETGKSIERINPGNPSSDSLNWSQSVSVFGATPGYVNSVTQKEYDLIADGIKFNPPFPTLNDTVGISAIIKNIGKRQIDFSVQLWEDTDLDSSLDLNTESSPVQILIPGDSLEYEFNYKINALVKKRAFGIKVISSKDQDTTNNRFYKSVKPGFSKNSVVINEIMFNPANGEPEWIELYNNTGQPVNLKNWTVSDVLTNPVTKIIPEQIQIDPKSFFVITKSSSIFEFHRQINSPVIELKFANLNNDEDGIVLRDDRGFSIDSVFYNASSNTKTGFSLERIDAGASSIDTRNWEYSTDIEQGTPGRINSVTPKKFDLSVAKISLSPNFPVPGEEVKVLVKIKNTGSADADNFSLQIYNGKNSATQLFEEHPNLKLDSKDSLTVSSRNSIVINDTISIAVQIIFNNDEDLGNNYSGKKFVAGFAQNDIVINEIMYKNLAGESEWVEFKNRSDKVINLKYWSVSDLKPTKNYITVNNALVNPSELFIVASDTGKLNLPDGVKAFEVDFGNLNNSTDGIILYDFRNAIIDSMQYKKDWGGKTGVSLERISTEVNSTDSLNWSPSIAPEGNTLGKQNSVLSVPQYSKGNVVINEIMYNTGGDNPEFIELYNNSTQKIQIGAWRFKNGTGKNYFISDGFKILNPHNFYLISSDSSIFNNYKNLPDSTNIKIINNSSFSLSNKGESISIYDLHGNLIDSVYYFDNWNNPNILDTKNKSLERINPSLGSNDPQNWSTSVDPAGATPNRENSIFTKNLINTASLSINPNPFSPDNDGFEDFTIFSYSLTHAVSQIRIRIFDAKGRLVRTLLNNSATGSTGRVIFDGLDDNKNPLKIGIYIVLLEAFYNSSVSTETVKKVVVIARKL